MQNNNVNMVPIAPAMNTGSNSSPSPAEMIQRKKRTRAKRSCDMCRKKKTRCDADVSQPCTKCKLANIECQFLVEQKKRGPSTGSYVEVLENRLLRMEKLLQNIATKSGKSAEEGDQDLYYPFQQEVEHTACPAGVPKDDGELLYNAGAHDVEEDDDISPEEAEEDLTGDSPSISCTTVTEKNTPMDDAYDEIQEKMKILTVSDYQRTRYIGASSGVHFLNEELLRTKKKHRIPEEPSWFVQKLNDDEEEHIIMKTKEVPNPAVTGEDGEEVVQANRIGLFEDTPHMTQELSDYLIHLYFTRVHIYCPMINKTQFLEQYYFHNPSPPDKYLLYAITCIGTALFIPDISLVQNFKFTIDQLHELHICLKSKAYKLLSIVYKRSMISTVQTLMLLSMFVGHGDNDDEDTSHWFITGMAIRMAQDLGLHRDCSKWNMPEHEIELRKRIWYAAYLMDRWVAAELGRPISILDHEFDVELPTPYELSSIHHHKNSELTPILILEAKAALEQKIPVYSGFLYMVTLSHIAGQVLIGFHSTRAKHNRGQDDNLQLLAILDRNLTKWKMSLPKELELDVHNISATFNAPACVVNMAYDCIWILLYRSFIKLHNIDQSEESKHMAFKALSICTASAINLVSIVEAMEHHSFVALPWNMAVYAVFQAAIIFLHNAKGENTFIKEQGRKYLNRCARVYNQDPYLRKTRHVKLLQQLVKQFEVNMEEDYSGSSNSSQNSSGTTPPPPAIIGQRRKRAAGTEEFPPFGKIIHPALECDDEEQSKHNAFVNKVMTTDNVYLPTNAQKHVRTDTGIYTVSRGNIDQGGRLTPDPVSSANAVNNFHMVTSTVPEDMFLSSLSFGLGKNTMNAIFNLQNQQQQEDAQVKKRKAAEEEQRQQEESVAAAAAIACPNVDPILCVGACPNDPNGPVDPLQCPFYNNNDNTNTANSFSTSTNTTPEVDYCPSMNIHSDHIDMNYIEQPQQQTYYNQGQQQQQFDIASLSSELPIWELPSGVTWNEWETFLKSTTTSVGCIGAGSAGGGST